MAANITSEKIDLLIYGPIRPILETAFPTSMSCTGPKATSTWIGCPAT